MNDSRIITLQAELSSRIDYLKNSLVNKKPDTLQDVVVQQALVKELQKVLKDLSLAIHDK